MSDFWALIMVNLRMAIRGNPKLPSKPWHRLVGLAVLGVLGFFFVSAALSLVAVVSAVIGPRTLDLIVGVYAVMFLFSFASIFVGELPAALATFTSNSDLRYLLQLPVSPRAVFAQKVLFLISFWWPIAVLFGLPLMFGVGLGASAGPLYLALVLPLVLLAPVLPVCLSILVMLGLLRVLPAARGRNIVTIVMAIVGSGIYLSVRIFFGGGHAPPAGTLATSQAVVGAIHGLSRSGMIYLPPAWPAEALALAAQGQDGPALLWALSVLLLAAVSFWATVTVAELVFANGWATYQEQQRRRVAPPRNPESLTPSPLLFPPPMAPGRGGERDALSALLVKEWKIFARDAQTWSRLVFPLALSVYLMYEFLNGRFHIGPPGLPAASSTFLSLLALLTFFGYIYQLQIVGPAMNREGKSLYILALGATRARTILLAKLLAGYLPVAALVELIWLTLGLARAVDPIVLLTGLTFLPLALLACSSWTLSVNLLFPHLDWDNPRRMLSTPAAIIGGVGGFVIVALLAGPLLVSSFFPGIGGAAVGAVGYAFGLAIITLCITLMPARVRWILAGGRL